MFFFGFVVVCFIVVLVCSGVFFFNWMNFFIKCFVFWGKFNFSVIALVVSWGDMLLFLS